MRQALALGRRAASYTFCSMTVLPIVRLGHPVLRGVAQTVEVQRIAGAAFQELIDDLVETMRSAQGVGLAAPQVGVPWQVFVYEVAAPRPEAGTPPPDAPEEGGEGGAGGAATPGAVIPLHVLINPMLTPHAGELVYDWEGCLSIPDLRGLVPRHPAVRVRALDRRGEPVDYLAEGFEARIVQHEYDHLNGVVFLDRMRDFRALAFRDEWERFMAERAAEPPPAELPPDATPASSPAVTSVGSPGAPDRPEPLPPRPAPPRF